MTDETPTGDPTPTGSEPATPPSAEGGGTPEGEGADLTTIPPIVPQTPLSEASTAEGPTVESPGAASAAGEATAPSPAAWPAAGAATAAPGSEWTPAPSGGARRVAVPLWLIIGLGGVLLLGLGFLGGWAVGSNDSDSRSASDLGQVRIGANPRLPGGNGNGNGDGRNGGGGGFTVPQPGTPNGNGVVLGVVTEPSSGDGARIVAVVPSSPADDGGLQRGDVITKVGDDDVKNPAQLATRVRSHKSGERVTVTYTRDGDTKSATVRLTNRTSIVPRIPTGPSNNDSAPQF